MKKLFAIFPIFTLAFLFFYSTPHHFTRSIASIQNLNCSELLTSILNPYAYIEEKLRVMPIKGRPEKIGKGASDPMLVTLKDGTQAVFKPILPPTHKGFRFSNMWAEIAAYRVSNYFGFDLVPPTVGRKINGQLGSLQLFIEGIYSPTSLDESAISIGYRATEDALRKQHFFDFVISNADRYEDNYLVKETGDIVSIDHGDAFHRRFMSIEAEPFQMSNEDYVVDILSDPQFHDIVTRIVRVSQSDLDKLVEGLAPKEQNLFFEQIKALQDFIRAKGILN